MKITRVEVFMLGKIPDKPRLENLWRPIGCRIHTDEGIYGDGEAAMCYGTGAPGAYGMLTDLAIMLKDENPMNIDYIWEKIYKSTFWGQNGGPVFFSALSAIDIALWDIKGKFLNQPVYNLLGGKHRDKLRSYASQLQLGWEDYGGIYTFAHTPEDFARNAKKAVSEGYDAIKVDFFQTGFEKGKFLTYQEKNGMLPRKIISKVEERIAAVRDAIGPDIDIIMENHSFPDANGAVALGQMAEKYGIYAFEEPNTPTPITSRYIERNINIPIANGERLYSRWQYAPYFEDGTIQLIQPDLGNCGGITEGRKIADMAHAYDVAVQAHVCASPLSTDVALHFEAAIPNFTIHEHHICHRMIFNHGLTKYNRQPENGYISPSDEPGIGNEFLQEAIDKALLYTEIK